MTTTPVEGVPNGIFAPSTAASANTSGTQADSQMFLQLMVAQLQYQDPMNPADTSEMLSQNATFTEVQAIQEMQQEMEMQLSSQLAFGATAMIGKQVSWTDAATGDAKSGTVQGATFTAQGPVLNVDGTDVPLTSVESVGTTKDASDGTGDTSGTDGASGSDGSTDSTTPPTDGTDKSGGTTT
jgi:flagellar basal-body rod modification protein FlgD